MSAIPPGKCDCCVCQNIHCFLDHEGHNKHGIEADLDALDLLLEIQREKDDATPDRE